jgi:hypothetical protein
MGSGRKNGCILLGVLGLTFGPPAALGQHADEGEFSRVMLGYKLQQLNGCFEQTKSRLRNSNAAGPALKQLERVSCDIKGLEAAFRCGRYYPDLLDERIVITREKLRLILAGPAPTGSKPDAPASLLDPGRGG